MYTNEKVIGIMMVNTWIANAAHRHPNKFTLLKASHFRERLCSETGI